MNFSPKSIAIGAAGIFLLILIIAWATGDTSDPEKKNKDLASLDAPLTDTPFLDDFGTPPVIDDPTPEETEPSVQPDPTPDSPSIAKPARTGSTEPTRTTEPTTPKPDTSVAKNQTSPVTPVDQGNGVLVKPNRPLPGQTKPPTKPRDTSIAKHTPKITPPSSQPGTIVRPARTPPSVRQPLKAVKVVQNTPPKAVPVAAKAIPLPPKAIPVPPKATPVAEVGAVSNRVVTNTPKPLKLPTHRPTNKAVPVYEDPPVRRHAQAKPAVVIKMKSPSQAPGANRSNVLKQARDLVSSDQLNTFLRIHDLPPRAIAADSNIARATHEEAVAFTAWLTHQHRAAGLIDNNTHYRLPTTKETRSTQIWRHDDNPTHTNTTRPVGIVLAKGARP